MTDGTIPMGPTARPKGMRPGSDVWRNGKRSDKVLFWTMMIVIGLTPLPFGSNRPFFWALSATITGVTILFWAVTRGKQFPFGAILRDVGLQAWLFGLFLLFLVVQILPIGPWLGVLASGGLDGLGAVPRTISLAPGDTLLMLLRQATYAGFFFLMLQVASRDRPRSSSLDILLIIITANAVIGLASLSMGDTILGLEKWAYLGSATGTFVNRNSFATFLAFGVVLAMTQLLDVLTHWLESRPSDREIRASVPPLLLYLSALLLNFAAVVSSQSRMGFVVTLCGILTVIVLVVCRNAKLVPAMLGIVASGLFAVVCLLIAYGDGLLGRLDVLEKSTDVRLTFYRQVLELISLRPWTGFGGGAFELAFPLVHQLPVSGDVVWDKAHNSYLALWSELGLFAGSIPLLLLFLIAARILAAWRARRGSWRAQTVALGAIVVGGVHSTVDFSLEIQANTIMFLALIALGYATSLKSAK
ncbi:O-antigen ligase family protein [Devosia beringensis]|uniref:O-antigen ligase family protein n=1 Tax=Devosia beringensis TaxID=2657486 RepID=UPI00186B8C89|nr:O-antigen ligase family protein [Devosia beringensis]